MSKYSSKSRLRSTTKPVYTPVFYATSQSSASGSAPPADVPGAYTDYMAKKRAALCQVEEIPSSRRGSSEADDAASQSRVDDLRRRVQEAFTYANGDTADGKWSTVVQLLRLPVAQRTRWLGSTTDGQPAESSIGWINARTEKEWEEWEGRFKQQLLLRKKVQSWQQKVEHLPGEPAPVVSTLDRKDAKKSEPLKVKRAKTLHVASRNQSALRFPVVKRSSLNVIGKPKPTWIPESNDALAGPIAGPSRREPEPQVDESSPPAKAPQKVIEDLSETSFLPPSFPSQLQTSTPNAKTDKRRKPEPIMLAPPSSPLLTPPSARSQRKSNSNVEVSSSLPEPPSTPTRYPKPTSLIVSPRINLREKRPRSATPQHAAIKQMKKARTEPALPVSTPEARVTQSTPDVQPITPEITPQRKQVPKLTDLLASSKKAKASPRSKTLLRKEPPPPPKPSEPLSAPPQPEEEQQEGQEEQEPQLEMENDKGTFQPYIFDEQDPDADIYEPLNDTDLGSRVGLHYGIASPAKSLSSLAASDSDEEEVHDPLADLDLDVDMSGFEPPFASTQAGAGTGGGWVGYNSQFDVDGKVDLVSKFMDKDVDFDGWLKDPSVEAEGVEDQ